MFVLDNVPLNVYSTMRLGGLAAHLVETQNRNEVSQAVAWAKERNLPVLMIGEGSNIVWRDEGFPGLVIVNKIAGFEITEFDQETSYITAGSGENWDSVVVRAIETGLSGIELLSLIPGTAGAGPVQNIGAYGGQLSDVLLTIEAFDLQVNQFVTLRGSECDFGYRTSRFKTADRHRFLITGITLQLQRSYLYEKLYHSLVPYLKKYSLKELTPQIIREAVIAVRTSKLPDPKIVANNGSFFQNPVISREHLEVLLEKYPEFNNWPATFMWDLPDGSVKVAAAALMEHAGLKGVKDNETGMAIWPNHALVFVNEHAKNTAGLLKFRQKVLDKIQAMYGITLEQEPELLP